MSSRSQLDRIFDPRSIAVVGASAEPAKRGNLILRALESSGYRGDVYPINPKGGRILDHDVLRSVDELPEGVDLAVLCTPAESSAGLVRALGARGVGGAVVLAVGYGESGEEGQALQAELIEAARASGVRIVGPNTSGMLNLPTGANLIGARGVRAGGLSVLVQSGNVALALMTEVTERSWDGISICVGVGNGIDVGFAEAMAFLRDHDETHAVIAYVEGLHDARAFLTSAARLTRSKPIVVIKSGRTEKGVEAALSHTGSVSGPYERFSAGLAQAGAVEVTRTDELLHVAETLGRQPPCPPDRGIAILSDGGGQGTLASDVLAESGATMATVQEGTQAKLRTLLGRAAAVRNPVDLAGAADLDPENFARALEIMLDDPGVGTVLVIGLFGGYGVRFADSLTPGEIRAAEAMAASARAHGKGLVLHTMYAAHRTEPLAVLGRAGVPVVGSLEVATRCVVELQRRGRFLARPAWAAVEDAAAPIEAGLDAGVGMDRGSDALRDPIAGARAQGRRTLNEVEARSVLSAAGLTFAPQVLAGTPDEAADAFAALGGTAAMKLVSSTIVHKSDAGGVVLGIQSAAAARRAFESIRASSTTWARRNGLDAEPTQVMLTRMLDAPRVELLIGAWSDAWLGPVLTVGAGGVWVEALADVQHRVLPILDEDIEEMLAGLRISKLLGASRGYEAVDHAPVVAAVHAVARTIARQPGIAEVEINPLFVYSHRVEPVDARIVLRGD